MPIRKKINSYFSALTNTTRRECEEINIPPDIVTKAKEGDYIAQLELGKAFYNATSIKNNYVIAFDWINRSAKQGNMEAQFILGDLYALGLGTTKSLSNSYIWYTKAAIQGYKKALIRIHNLYQEDIKMHCRGIIDDEEKECATDDFKKENNIRELYEYRLEQNKNILNGAIEYYTNQFKHYQSSDQNNPDIQLNLAFLYQHGYGTRKNSRWAFEYYSLAAEQGSIDAQYNIGHLYQQHTGKKFNYRHALKWYIQSAQGGNISAQRCLAYFYLKGLAIDINYELAIFWYTEAANAGDSQSQVTLGLLYRKGDYIKQDLSMAVRWYTLAARQGNKVAQNCLSQLHQRGMLTNVELDEDISNYFTDGLVSNRLCSKLSSEASKLKNSPTIKQFSKLVKHALIGDGPAMYDIGLKYYYGDGDFPQDKDTGIKWIKNAANREHKDAQFFMTDLYKEGDSAEQNYLKTYIWYKKIAKQKDANAQCKVGVAYYKGLGVRKDPLEASKWFTWAADQGNSDAQFHFGMLRLYGHGIRENKKEAEEWLYASVVQRNTLASHKLGKLYCDGLYNTKKKNHMKTGLRLLEFAAQHGNTDAQIDLGSIYKNGKHVQQDIPKSIEYYTMAADLGDAKTQYELAIKYLNGYDVNQDYIKAYNLFKKASNSGHKDANNLFQIPLVIDSEIKNCSNILNVFVKVTEKRIANLAYNLGFLYEFGLNGDSLVEGVIINYDKAEKWYLLASKEGDSRADYRLGIMYEFSKGVPENLSTATKYYKNAAKNQNSDAMYKLACINLKRDDLFHSCLNTFHLFTNASTLGSKNATEMLTVLERDDNAWYDPDGFGEHSDIAMIKKNLISILKKATKKGHAQLQYKLAVMYERHNNTLEALEWLHRAADIGITDAYYRLGVIYEEGRDVKKNYAIAINMYQKSIIKDHEDAYFRLGQLYQYGNGVERDYLKAYELYKKAADMDHDMTTKVLNITQEAKIQANKNKENEFFESSSKEYQGSLIMCKYVAEHGDPEVQFKVGFAYENCFSEPNYNEAFKWYFMASKNSHKEAMYHLGLFYEKGLGISQDYHKAIELYNQAYQLGSEDALHRLGTVYHHGKGVEIDPAKAVEYYTLSAKFGNPIYQCVLGQLYEEGELVQKNLLKALKWYTKAYLQGYNDIGSKLYAMYEDKPYESFFFQKLLRNLSVASCNYFSLNEKYEYKYLGDINNRVGFLYFFGQGTDKSLKKSLSYFMKEYSDKNSVVTMDFYFFEKNGFSFSQKMKILKWIGDHEDYMNPLSSQDLFELGMAFFEGIVQREYIIFDRLKEKSAPVAKPYLDDFIQPIVIEKDYSAAFSYMKKAADKKYQKAFYQLGIMYYYGCGTQKNNAKGDSCFNLIPLGNIESVKRMAILCHTHNDINNFSKAFECYKHLEKTAGESFDISEDNRNEINEFVHTGLGLLFEYGDGVEQDYQKSIGYYEKAVEYKSKLGYLRLGLIHYYGKGVLVDYKKAYDYFRGSYGGYIYGDRVPYVYHKNTLPGRDNDDDDDSKDKLVYCTITEERILGEIYYYKGLMYKYGQGVQKDGKLAENHFKLALKTRYQHGEKEEEEGIVNIFDELSPDTTISATTGYSRLEPETLARFQDINFSRSWSANIPQELLKTIASKEIRRQEDINELIYTEGNYVRDLNILHELFAKPLLTGPYIEQNRIEEFHRSVFGNYMAILKVNREMYRELRDYQLYCLEVQENAIIDEIGLIFLKYIKKFKDTYVNYASNCRFAEYKVEQEMNNNILFNRFIRETERQSEIRRLSFRHFLFIPIVRIQRYTLLLDNVLKKTDDQHPDSSILAEAIQQLKYISNMMELAKKKF